MSAPSVLSLARKRRRSRQQMSSVERGVGPVPREVGEERWTVPVNTLSPPEIKALFGGK
ncbi:MAG: hypothetical protein ACLPV8_18195 [Steroidobacteraceae bacterium]